jgi:hypothetical protein
MKYIIGMATTMKAIVIQISKETASEFVLIKTSTDTSASGRKIRSMEMESIF